MLLLDDLHLGLTDLFRIILHTYNFNCFTELEKTFALTPWSKFPLINPPKGKAIVE